MATHLEPFESDLWNPLMISSFLVFKEALILEKNKSPETA